MGISQCKSCERYGDSKVDVDVKGDWRDGYTCSSCVETREETGPVDTALNAFLAHLGTDLEPHERWRYREAMRLAVRAYVGMQEAAGAV